ncbi:hypothetical protein [Streptomyces colonosanans]|uniref:Uncharacterized protein n=1 Tax=Streptomyces colonosanans TaxID=1428652 RepID=A0A1S2PNR0_9ACTN|nr:hypothetical protein [Streptomyces colonosanans]OIJ95447.1 hypothetical protein BIV24_09215 [Streptomyces colonosanans]
MTDHAAPAQTAAVLETLLKVPAPVVPLLALPPLKDVTDGQSRGTDCVWCRDPLTLATAVDLGTQKSPQDGPSPTTGATWYPRTCQPCMADHAHRALFEHARICEQCVDETGECKVGRVLYRLIREGRR